MCLLFSEVKMEDIKKTVRHRRMKDRAIIGLSIATAVLGATTIGFGIGYGVTENQAKDYSVQLENVYQRNYYELVDGVNNADMQVSKILASNSETYRAKLLSDLSQTAKQMQSNIAELPLESENLVDCVRFINQLSGYTKILDEKLAKGGQLSDEDLKTLEDIHQTLTEMKVFLNKFSSNMQEGYSVVEASQRTDGQLSEFANSFSQVKSNSTDYPTMIYDGPFSDSVVNQQVKGLSGNQITRDQAYQKIDKTFKNVSSIKNEGETNGKFETYNFSIKTTDSQFMSVQVSKIGGHILTISGNVKNAEKNISFDQAEKIALDFAKENGIEQPKVVWSQELDSQTYLNIAPVQNGVILYPDLIKVKVDMTFGDIIGYDAVTYFTNHTDRALPGAKISKESARDKIESSFKIEKERLVLAPLDYNREELCFEFECLRDGATYYIYINAETGEEENVLKVVETTDGSKLM